MAIEIQRNEGSAEIEPRRRRGIKALLAGAVAAVGIGRANQEARADAFTPGNLVVYRTGTGAAALSSSATAVFLDEYTTAGVFVQSIAAPTSDNGLNQTLTASGTAVSEGRLSLSEDGKYLMFTGYDAAIGTTSVAGTVTSGGSAVARVIGRADAAGTLDTTTTTTRFSGTNIRGATSTNGTDIWATGANTGVIYSALGGTGASTIVSNTTTNLRDTHIVDGQLYVSSGTNTLRVGSVGTGTPTGTGNTTTNLSGIPLSAGTPISSYGFFMADLSSSVPGMDTLYIASDDANALQKFTLNGGTWTSNGTIGVNSDDYLGLTGTVSGGSVTLYATRYNGVSADQIVTLTDSSGYNGAFTGTPTVLVTASSANNIGFRGISFTPSLPDSLVYLKTDGVGDERGDVVTSGSNGSYSSSVLDLATSQNTGYVNILGGFPNPSGDAPALVMVDLNGTGPDNDSNGRADDIDALLESVQAGAGSSGFTILDPSDPTFAALASYYAGPGRTWDAIFSFSPVTDSGPGSLKFSWDFSANPTVTLDKLVVVPEPASAVSILGLGAFGVFRTRRGKKK